MTTEVSATAEDIESSHSLFLLEASEPEENSLLIVLGESSLGERENLEVAGVVFRNIQRLSNAASVLDKVLRSYENVACKRARTKGVGGMRRKVKCNMHFLYDES